MDVSSIESVDCGRRTVTAETWAHCSTTERIADPKPNSAAKSIVCLSLGLALEWNTAIDVPESLCHNPLSDCATETCLDTEVLEAGNSLSKIGTLGYGRMLVGPPQQHGADGKARAHRSEQDEIALLQPA